MVPIFAVGAGTCGSPAPSDRGKTSGWLNRNTTAAAALFVALLAVYHANGDFLVGYDQVGNVFASVSLLREGNVSFTPTELPAGFDWDLTTTEGRQTVGVRRWDDRWQGRTYAELRRAGALQVGPPGYFLVPTSRRDRETGEPLYVNMSGPAPGMVALPVVAVLDWVTGDLLRNPLVIWYGAKLAASMLVAGSAAFVFLTAAAFTTRNLAMLVAVCYGLATCVWSISSQALWQHAPTEFFLALGTWLLTRVDRRAGPMVWCGLAYSAAVACRPNSAVVCLAAGVYLVLTYRRRAWPFFVACLPIAVGLAWYNTYYFGSPWTFDKIVTSRERAVMKTGSPDLWSTPLWVGAAGLLVSPSRGLFVYSPFLLFAIAGAIACWRRGEYRVLRPVAMGAAGLMLVAFKWHDWWGGWCFGYRPLVDTAPLLSLLLVPVLATVLRRRVLAVVFFGLVAWSVLVQIVGAFAYDFAGWNARVVAYNVFVDGRSQPLRVEGRAEVDRLAAEQPVLRVEEVRANIDRPEHRHRLWDLRDNQIGYHLMHFGETRAKKHQEMQAWGNRWQ